MHWEQTTSFSAHALGTDHTCIGSSPHALEADHFLLHKCIPGSSLLTIFSPTPREVSLWELRSHYTGEQSHSGSYTIQATFSAGTLALRGIPLLHSLRKSPPIVTIITLLRRSKMGTPAHEIKSTYATLSEIRHTYDRMPRHASHRQEHLPYTVKQ